MQVNLLCLYVLESNWVLYEAFHGIMKLPCKQLHDFHFVCRLKFNTEC